MTLTTDYRFEIVLSLTELLKAATQLKSEKNAYLQLHRVITNSTVEFYSAIFDAIALGIKRLVGSDEQLDKTNGDSWVLL